MHPSLLSKKRISSLTGLFVILLAAGSCKETTDKRAKQLINEAGLKRGAIISCSPGDNEFGSVLFESSYPEKVSKQLNFAITLLHSFEYEEAEKAFAKIIDEFPDCAMAYWGVAMANFHPLWTPPAPAEIKKGAIAIQIAQSLESSKREEDYINALAAFYKDWEKADHRSRCRDFEEAMENLYVNYPKNKEAAIFYALALNAAADPADKSFQKQKKAGPILDSLYPDEPGHPGIAHYIIHTYDYPELAERGLAAARKYASIAPASAHALHMPSHIFTRLGLWDECIGSNVASVSSAKCYAEAAGINGHWDEEFHGLDYLVYAYLQKGETDSARQQMQYLQTIPKAFPVNFKVAYAYAAIPSRMALENSNWEQASTLKLHPASFPWKEFPWQKAIIHFTHLLGSVNTNKLTEARKDLKTSKSLHEKLLSKKDLYQANQVDIQIKSGEAWINLKEGNKEQALSFMNQATDLEEKTGKHPVTPGEVIPARELLGNMLLYLNEPAKALDAYELNLKSHPNRFNALYGAGLAAKKSGKNEKAILYFGQLVKSCGASNKERIELTRAREYLKQ